MKLRIKILISLCAILLGFGFATVQAVKRICEIQIRKVLLGDLQNSVITFRSFERESDQKLTDVSELLASMPALKALMTTQDVATIQDGSDQIWRLAGSDLLVLADRNGKVVAAHGSSSYADSETLQSALGASIQRPRSRGWGVIEGRLFETVSTPIYFGPPSNSHLLGTVTVGYEINQTVTRSIADIAASQVAFQCDGTIVSSTLSPTQVTHLPRAVLNSPAGEAVPSEVKIEGERFLATSLALSDSPKAIRLIVLKSFDQASLFLGRVNEIVLAMNVIAIFIGCGLVLLISRKFTKPLDDLLEGVRALEQRNFSYPLPDSGNDEFTELTSSFHRMRSNLAAAEEKLLEAERSATIGRMASSISHDLRHRLTSIIANSEFLAESGLRPERKQELYENVRAAVRKMTDLLESLLEFSRTPQALRLENVPVEEIVEDAVAAIRLHPQFENLPICIDSPELIWGWFDPRTLERGLYNLLLNACEMVPHQVGHIDVNIQRLGSNVEIRVSDNGPGIPECIREKLFQPFVSHGKQHGSGLGLAIVQKACFDHNGTVVLENSSPEGTTFRIVLPLACRLSTVPREEEVSGIEVVYGAPHGY